MRNLVGVSPRATRHDTREATNMETQRTKSAEAARRILNVATTIELNEDRYRQHWFAQIRRGDDYLDEINVRDEMACGMAYCIGGWNWVLHHDVDTVLYVEPLRSSDDEWVHYDFDVDTSVLMEMVERDFELSSKDAAMLCASSWTPRRGLSVADALRAIALGSTVADVTDEDHVEQWLAM